MITISIDPKMYKKIQKYLNDNRFRRILGDVLLAAGLDLESMIVENIYERASNTGRLAQSWHTIKKSNTRVEVRSNVHYASYVEFGTRPHRPPIDPLKKWIREKFQLRGKEADRVAWKVWHKIAEQGTPPKRYLRDAVDSFDLNEYIKELVKEWENVR